MARKRPSSRDQKALTILDANLSTVEDQENLLLVKIWKSPEDACGTLNLLLNGIAHNDDDGAGREAWIETCECELADASRTMRQLRKLQKEAI